MKATVLASELFFRHHGRTLTTREAISLLQDELAKRRSERDHCATIASELQARHRTTLIQGQRLDRRELDEAERRFQEADSHIHTVLTELNRVHRVDVDHRSQGILRDASEHLTAIEQRYTAHAPA